MKQLIRWYSGLNIYYKLVPFLLLYIAICILFPKEETSGDQGRYLRFTNNLLHGFYSPPFPDVDLWSGPGYPVFLAPLLALKMPHVIIRVLNAFLLYFSLVLCYKTILFYCSKRTAFLFAALLGMYFPIYELIRQILTEALTWYLIALICYLFAKNYRQRTVSWKLVLLTGLTIAYLAMTKIIFGYVILAMLLSSIALLLLPAFRIAARKSVYVFMVAFIFCLPWLFYTYQLTGKPFYWSNSGNMSLYTMSTPFDNETGQWYDEPQLVLNPHHKAFIDSITRLEPLQRDDAYKAAAVKNIREHPKKYAMNLVSNVGRLLFFPSDYAPDTLLSYYPFVPNIFIVVLIVAATGLAVWQHKRLPQELILLFLFILIYLSGSTLVSAYRRMFFVTMPFWFLFMAYVFNNIITIRLKVNEPR